MGFEKDTQQFTAAIDEQEPQNPDQEPVNAANNTKAEPLKKPEKERIDLTEDEKNAIQVLTRFYG